MFVYSLPRATGVVALISIFVVLLSGCFNQNPAETQTHSFSSLSSDRLQVLLEDDEIILIDARSPDAFNGWHLAGDTLVSDQPEGHIPGAQLFSARWIEQELDNLDEAWRRTGADKPVVIYGENQKQASQVADWFVNNDILPVESIRILEGGVFAWRAGERQLDYLPGFRSLVPPEYVARAITRPETRVIEIGWDGGKGADYRKSHIPGALYWDDLEFETPPIYEARPVKDIRLSLARLGINKDTPVVVYSTKSIGGGRGAAILKYAGVDNVVMLNGGIDAWVKAGFETESGWNEPVPVTGFGVTGAGDRRVMIDVEEAAQIRTQSNSALVSIRAWKEYIGEVSGYNYFSKRGRIPGALWGHAGDTSWDMSHFHNPDGTMRSYHQIDAFWQEWGITPDMTLSFYCGNGWRASEAWWYAQAMGYSASTIYSSGWMRWREDERPVASGSLTQEQSITVWQEVSGHAEKRILASSP